MIGHLADGRIVFVEGALPGEIVTAVVTERRRDFARARVEEVLRASPDRVTAPCAHRRRGCGGCPWQEVGPAAQIANKEAIVADALRRIGRIPDAVLAATVPVATTGYRTTVHLALDAEGRPAYHRRHEDTLLAVDSCLVAHPRLSEVLESLRLPGHDRASVRVGLAGGERLVVLPAREPQGRYPRPGARPAGDISGPGAPAGPTRRPVIPAGVEVVAPGGNATVHEAVGGRLWRVSARVFFQPGPAAAEALVAAVDAAVGDALRPGGLLVDAYAGVGVLGGVIAARRRSRLVAVESDPQAARDAAHNLADLDASVLTAEVGAWRAVPADVVVADPARTGLGRPGVTALAACGAPRLVLVSCDAASLGRDAALLVAAGYELIRTQLIDSFAQTVHIEAVSVFETSRR